MVEVVNCWMENFNENLQAYFKEARQDRICSSSWQPKKKKKKPLFILKNWIT